MSALAVRALTPTLSRMRERGRYGLGVADGRQHLALLTLVAAGRDDRADQRRQKQDVPGIYVGARDLLEGDPG